ncbi:hypothetical protein B0H19DRAFT_1270696 [Mycena capillaripes]|nr:hypothetical protein B0H19DRAFT_1270696 [Mycena capillaripes]
MRPPCASLPPHRFNVAVAPLLALPADHCVCVFAPHLLCIDGNPRLAACTAWDSYPRCVPVSQASYSIVQSGIHESAPSAMDAAFSHTGASSIHGLLPTTRLSLRTRSHNINSAPLFIHPPPPPAPLRACLAALIVPLNTTLADRLQRIKPHRSQSRPRLGSRNAQQVPRRSPSYAAFVASPRTVPISAPMPAFIRNVDLPRIANTTWQIAPPCNWITARASSVWHLPLLSGTSNHRERLIHSCGAEPSGHRTPPSEQDVWSSRRCRRVSLAESVRALVRSAWRVERAGVGAGAGARRHLVESGYRCVESAR